MRSWITCTFAALALCGGAQAARAQATPDAIDSLRGPAGEQVRYQAWVTHEALTPTDTNNAPDVYLKDLQSGQVELVSVGPDGKPGAQGSEEPSVSGDGSFVAFVTRNALLPEDNNTYSDIYAYDRTTREVHLVSRTYLGKAGNAPSSQPAVAWDGEYVAFASQAGDLVRGDDNYVSDIFLWNRRVRIPRRVNVHADGSEFDKPSFLPAISQAGVYVGFRSLARLFPSQTSRDFSYYVVEAPGLAGRAHRALYLIDSDTFEVVEKRVQEGAPPPSAPLPAPAPAESPATTDSAPP